MHNKKKYLYGLIGIVAVLMLLNFGINRWLAAKLPEIIEEKTQYAFKFEELNVSVFSGSIAIKGINAHSKTDSLDPKASYATARIGQLDINGINFFKYLTSKDISIASVIISNPEIVFFKSSIKEKDSLQHQEKMDNSILIKTIKIIKGDFQLKERTSTTTSDKSQSIVHLDAVDFSVEEVVVSATTVAEKIPFSYKNIALAVKAFEYHPSEVYVISTKNFALSDKSLSLDSLAFKPKMSKNQFVNHLKTEKDLYDISAQSIVIKDWTWGFIAGDLFVKTPLVEVNTVVVDIFRSKVPEDDTTKKELYSKLLRELPFYLEIEKLALKNSDLIYEEEIVKNEVGKLSFSKFDATILNINSGYKKTKLPDTELDIDCIFMHESELKVKWSFNAMDKTEHFKIKGSIYNYDLEQTTPFLKPRMHLSAEGRAQEIAFNFAGSDITGTGDFMINYDDLKITFYKKNLREKNILKGFLASIVVKSSSKGEQKEVEINPVTRKQDRSFFNFFWSCILQGLEQTILEF